jgi:hypothetical protein
MARRRESANVPDTFLSAATAWNSTMHGRRTLRDAATGAVLYHLAPHARLAALTGLAAAPIVLVAAFVPRPLVLPVLSLAAVAAAALVALFAWVARARRRGDTITAWDIAGAFALIGCAAAMFSEPENVLDLLGRTAVP